MSPRSASATGGWVSSDNAIDARQPRSSVMFTVCPKCALTLVVTTEDLRVAQGYVRCGRCSSVFNALARLTEDRATSEESLGAAPAAPAAPPPREQGAPQPPPPASRVPVQAPQANAPPQSVTDADAIPEDALEFDPSKTDVSSVFVEPPPDPQWTAATGTFQAMIAANQEAAQASPPASAAPPAQSVPDADAIPEDAVEFDPSKTDVSSVFVEPPPDPQWTAATGTFQAMIAANQEAAQAPPPASAAPPAQSVTDADAIPEDALEFDPSKTDVSSVVVEPPPAPQWPAATGTFQAVIATNQEAAQAQDSDSQIDVEIDPELLASILHIKPPVPPAPPAAPPPVTPPPIRPPHPPPNAATAAPDSPTDAASSAPQPAPRQAAPPARPAPEEPVSAPSAPSQPRAPRKTRPAVEVDPSAGMA